LGTVEANPEPRKLGSFEILEEIGQGGMGVVYLARQPALERQVVLKKIRRELLADPEIVERFQREARAAAGVHHQNVVTVYHCFTSRGDHYIAQEFVEGVDLRSVLDKLGRVEPQIAALIALEVIRGLEEIHARGIVHRDLKPGNILIGRCGETKIADFGIAFESASEELTRPGTMLGSLRYMSPEQMLGERIDYRSDLFSFGVLLYEMVTGGTPFRDSADDDTDTLLERMQRERYVPPGRRGVKIPGYLARLIRTCLRGRSARRVRSATEIRRQLERRLRAISPADCRGRIAAFLWRHGIVRPAEDETEKQPSAARGGRSRSPRSLRWLLPGAAVALLLVITIGYGLRIPVDRNTGQPIPSEPAREVQDASSLPAATGPPESMALPLDEDVALESTAAITPAEQEMPALEPQGAEDSLAGSTETSDGAVAGEQTNPSPVPAVSPDPARVRFVVKPWAEVRLEDGTSFYTPRAEPVSLEPGSHRIVFAHPRYGTAELTVDLEEGEERLIRHVYEEAADQ
jgi:serine/threonine-protein kinase